MATQVVTPHLDANAMALQRTDLATLRTRLGSERTLMAAIRTSLSLIGFGFTIYKVFESVLQKMGDQAPIRENAPRRLGLALVSLGLFVLVATAWQHWLFLGKLQTETERHFPWSVSMSTAAILTLIGIVVLITILVRL